MLTPYGSFGPKRGLAGVLLLAAVSFTAACTPQTVISTPAANAPVRGITVSGVGKASGAPSVARSTVGVEARAGSAEEAIAEVNTRMAQVIAAVKQAGVAAADVRTSTLSLNFERNYEQPPRPVELAPPPSPAVAPKGAGPSATATKAEAVPAPSIKLPQGFYTATNSVEVTIRNLDSAGKVLNAATAAGANQLYGVRFEIEDLAPLQAESRKKAVEDARARAARLAELSGVKLGSAISIVELDGGGHSPMPMMAMAKMESANAIERGELTISTTVQIVFGLGD